MGLVQRAVAPPAQEERRLMGYRARGEVPPSPGETPGDKGLWALERGTLRMILLELMGFVPLAGLCFSVHLPYQPERPVRSELRCSRFRTRQQRLLFKPTFRLIYLPWQTGSNNYHILTGKKYLS